MIFTFCLVLLLPLFTYSNQCGPLYITESAKSKHFILNWNFTCNNQPDTIVLSSNDPSVATNLKILQKITTENLISGYYETNYGLTETTLPGGWTNSNSSENPDLDATCLPFYISSYRNNELVDYQCFSIQPAWMNRFKKSRINKMLIPGTHNSGAFTSHLPSIVTNWVFTQSRDIWQQMVFGIRFMDIRVGRYGDPPNNLFINHGMAQCTLLKPQLENIQEFLRKSPSEVVILNFHDFPIPENFNKTFHLEVLSTIQDVFGTNILPYSNTPPLIEDCINKKKRVIISYNDYNIVQENSWLWPEITRYWPNTMDIEYLKNYIKKLARNPIAGNPMSVIMTELTPDEIYIATHLEQSLKDLADLVNRDLDSWITENKNYQNLNIIAADYFTGTNLVNIAIQANEESRKRNKNENDILT